MHVLAGGSEVAPPPPDGHSHLAGDAYHRRTMASNRRSHLLSRGARQHLGNLPVKALGNRIVWPVVHAAFMCQPNGLLAMP